MKPFENRKRILDGVDDARAEVTAAAQSVQAAAALGMIAFALISIVALVALAHATRR